jgi:hypothetical protein
VVRKIVGSTGCGDVAGQHPRKDGELVKQVLATGSYRLNAKTPAILFRSHITVKLWLGFIGSQLGFSGQVIVPAHCVHCSLFADYLL